MSRIRLNPDPAAIGIARRFVERSLAGVGVDDEVALLLVSELATEVVKHAGTDFDVLVDIGPVVRVEVRDGAAVTDAFRQLLRGPPGHVDASALGGRGWMLVSTLASNFGLTDHGAAGKALWFELAIRGDCTGTRADGWR